MSWPSSRDWHTSAGATVLLTTGGDGRYAWPVASQRSQVHLRLPRREAPSRARQQPTIGGHARRDGAFRVAGRRWTWQVDMVHRPHARRDARRSPRTVAHRIHPAALNEWHGWRALRIDAGGVRDRRERAMGDNAAEVMRGSRSATTRRCADHSPDELTRAGCSRRSRAIRRFVADDFLLDFPCALRQIVAARTPQRAAIDCLVLPDCGRRRWSAERGGDAARRDARVLRDRRQSHRGHCVSGAARMDRAPLATETITGSLGGRSARMRTGTGRALPVPPCPWGVCCGTGGCRR